jgi:hypothetical protein
MLRIGSQKIEEARERVVEQAEQAEPGEAVFDRLRNLAQLGGEGEDSDQAQSAADLVPAGNQITPEEVQQAVISSYDKEIMEMIEHMNAEELLLKGELNFELEVVPDVLSVSVRSLKKSDLREIQSDVDDFRGGRKVSEDSEERVLPSLQAIEDFSDMRHITQGIVGINGNPLPSDWLQRAYG